MTEEMSNRLMFDSRFQDASVCYKVQAIIQSLLTKSASSEIDESQNPFQKCHVPVRTRVDEFTIAPYTKNGTTLNLFISSPETM